MGSGLAHGTETTALKEYVCVVIFSCSELLRVFIWKESCVVFEDLCMFRQMAQ